MVTKHGELTVLSWRRVPTTWPRPAKCETVDDGSAWEKIVHNQKKYHQYEEVQRVPERIEDPKHLPVLVEVMLHGLEQLESNEEHRDEHACCERPCEPLVE